MKLVISSRLAPIHREVILKAWKAILVAWLVNLLPLKVILSRAFLGPLGPLARSIVCFLNKKVILYLGLSDFQIGG